MENSIDKALINIQLDKPLTTDEYDSILLYYIAVTRCRVEVIGADNLENIVKLTRKVK